MTIDLQSREKRISYHDDKLMSMLRNFHCVKLQDDNFSDKLSWCLKNCKHKFRDLSQHEYRSWYFENSDDAALFALKWS